MVKHFRLELNIGQEKPLPQIMEDKRGEDDLISETDPREKYPITEAEKTKIEQTRAQVTEWFPVWEAPSAAELALGASWKTVLFPIDYELVWLFFQLFR